jgi:predicted nuclease with TOPRIM domain
MSTIKKAHNLKQLSSEKEKVDLKIIDINKNIRELSKDKQKLRDKSVSLKNRIDSISKDLVVSEHAIIRYIERVQGLDLKEIRNEILTDKIKKQYSTVGNGTFPNDNFNVIIKNGTVVTVEN